MQFLFVFAVIEFAFGGKCLEDFKESQNTYGYGSCDASECLAIQYGQYAGQGTCINQDECDVSICPENDGVSTCFSQYSADADQYGHLCATGDGCPLAKIDGNIKTCTYPTNLVSSVCDTIYTSDDCLANNGCYMDKYSNCHDKALAGTCSSLNDGDCSLVQVDGVAACMVDPESGVGCRRKRCSDYNSMGNCPSSLIFPYCEWRVDLSPEEGVGACVSYGFPLGNCGAYNFSGACEADTTTSGDGCAWMKAYEEGEPPFCGSIRYSSCEYFINSGKCNVAPNCFWNRGKCESLSSILSCDELDSNNCGRPEILPCVPEAGECRRKKCGDSYADVASNTMTCINDPSCQWIYAYSSDTPVLGESAGTCVSIENLGGCASFKHPQQCMEIAGCLFVDKPGTGSVCVSESSVTDCAWITDSSICNKNDQHSQANCVWQTSACVASPCGSLTEAGGCTSNTNCLWVKNKAGDGGLCVSSASLVLCEQYQNHQQCDDSTKGCTWTADYYDPENYELQEKCLSLALVNSLECGVLTNQTRCENKVDCMWTSVGVTNSPGWLDSQFGGHCTFKCTNIEEEEGCSLKSECYSKRDGAGAFASCKNRELLQCADFTNNDYACSHFLPCAYESSTGVCRDIALTCAAATLDYECGYVVGQDCYWDHTLGQCLVRPVSCEDRDASSCGYNECYFSSELSACLEKTNTCADYETQYNCEHGPVTETNEPKCYWGQVYDEGGNPFATCKEITNNCGDYESYQSCENSPHAVKCYYKSEEDGSSSCLPVSHPCTATDMNDCYSSGLCDVVYLNSDYTNIKCVRRPCSSYASDLAQCQMFDDCASHAVYPFCSEIPDPTPLVSCDGGLSEQACIAKGEACEWKGAETGCSYTCESRRSKWSCTSNGCAYILAAYTGNGKCVTTNSVACNDYENKAQCDSSKDARGNTCIYAKSLAAGASETDFVCRQVSQTCGDASTDQECQKVVDLSTPISLGGRSCEWDYTNNDCKHLNCSHIGEIVKCEEFESCFYDSDNWACHSSMREDCDSVNSENCPKITLTNGGKCYFSEDGCTPLDLSGLSACTDGNVDTCDYITPSSGGSCYWDGDSCEILPTACNARSVLACPREHYTGCYVPTAGAPRCAAITTTCSDYTSKTDCEKYVLSSTNPSYKLCYWKTSGGSGQCVESNSQLCTASDKDDCVTTGVSTDLCFYDDLAKKCKHYGCGTYSEEICGLIYGCEYVDSTCQSIDNEITKCDELSSSNCVSGSELAQLDCVVDEAVCRQKVCTDINTQASCNDYVPAGGTGRCVWTKGAAAGNPQRCVPLSSVSNCESFVESSTCILLDTCIWNILDESTVCLNKSAIISCSSVNKTHCSDITNKACFLPEGAGKTCVEGKCTDISGTTSDKKDSCLAIPACSWIYSSSENTNTGSCVFRDAVQCGNYIKADQCDDSLDAQEKQCVHASPYTSGENAPAVCKVLSLSCADATSEKECGKVDDKVTLIDGCKWDVSNHKCRNFLCTDFATECPDSCLSAGPVCSSYERSSCDLDDPLSCAKIILPGGKTCHYSGGKCRPLDNCNDGDSTNCNEILTSGNDRCYWDDSSCKILPTECQDRPQVACTREHSVGCYFSSSLECREISSSCSGYMTETDCHILKSDIAEAALKCFWNSAGAASGNCVEASKSCASAFSQPDCSSSGLCIYSDGTCQHKPCSTYFDTATCTFAGCEYSTESSSCGACSELDANSCTSREGCVWNDDSGVCSKKKSSPETEPKKSNAGVIAGAVIGSIVILIAIVVGVTVLALYLKKLGPFKKDDTVEEGKGANEKNDVEMTTTNPISKK